MGANHGGRARAGSRYPIRDKSGVGRGDRLRCDRGYRASTARLAAGDRAGADARSAPPSRTPSHNCLTTGALVRKATGGGGVPRGARRRRDERGFARKNRPGSCRGTRGVQRRADPSMRERAEGRALDQPRNARTRDTATWAKKNTRWTLRTSCARSGGRGRCDVARRTSTSQNRELTSSSAGAAAAFFPLPTAARGTDFSAVLLRFGIGIAGGSPSSPEFACFIPAELALASPRFEPLPTSAAITIFDRIF